MSRLPRPSAADGSAGQLNVLLGPAAGGSTFYPASATPMSNVGSTASLDLSESSDTSDGTTPRGGCERCRHGGSCLQAALKAFTKNFLIAYNIRAGVSVLLRLIAVLRSKEKLSIRALVDESVVAYREDAVRLGLFFGGFAGLYKASLCSLRRLALGNARWASAIAGAVASVPCFLFDSERRRTLSLYAFARAMQCLYNAAKSRGAWHFWGSDWKHGDALLFVLSSAQVMYGYAMAPHSLPPSYYKFIVRAGPVTEAALQATRNSVNHVPLDVPALLEHVKSVGGRAFDTAALSSLRPHSPLIPCAVLHPASRSCTTAVIRSLTHAMRFAFPVYLALHLVPAVTLHGGKFVKKPLASMKRVLTGTARSTLFLGAFPASYLAFICAHRHVASTDSRYVYFAAGIVGALSILIEEKSRRAELGMYVLPRALDSLYNLLHANSLAPAVPGGDGLLFALSIGVIMYCRTSEPGSMSAALNRILKQLLGAEQEH